MRALVSLARCPSYTDTEAAMERLLEPLGGMSRFVKPGSRVLLKPNLLTDGTPDDGKTTHPNVVRALIRQVRAAGGRPEVGDSPSNVMKLERVWERTGYAALCREEGVPLVNMEKSGSQTFSIGEFQLAIARPVLEADLVISVPKIKTHVLTVFTGAVKNMYGVVPGFQKTALHKEYPQPHEFGKMLAALYSKVPPGLAVADAVVAMDGDGPTAGTLQNLGLLAASSDAVALDVVLCRHLHISLSAVPYFRPLEERGIGVADPARIDLCGDSLDGRPAPVFRMPATLPLHWIPLPLIRILRPLVWIRPSFTDACRSCGQCVRACPTGALQASPGENPVLIPGRCIECCCCHEICPAHAITMRLSPLLRMARRRSSP